MAEQRNQPDVPADKMGISLTVTMGFLIIFLFFGLFIGWASVAPLSSAALAPGTVSVEGNRKTIQHLEGGIISEILVQDGSHVEKGEVLVILDGTQAQASLELVRGRKIVALSQMARLIAERDGAVTITFPDWLEAQRQQPMAQQSIVGQVNIFEARRKSRESQVAILNQRIAQFETEILGLEGQIASADRQIELIGDEIRDVGALVEKGAAKLPRLRALQRTAAELDGNRGQNLAFIAKTLQAIGETNLQINELTISALNEVVQELRDIQSQIFDLAEQERSSLDILERTEIRAPTSGVVVGLQVHTSGGVIASGEPILDIVPLEERLIVEAKVNTGDIDSVHLGLAAQIRFPAISTASTQPADGTVIGVSADSLMDEQTGAFYYLTRVQIESTGDTGLDITKLRPGMQAEVMILTGERTALDYFLTPLLRSFNRSLREK